MIGKTDQSHAEDAEDTEKTSSASFTFLRALTSQNEDGEGVGLEFYAAILEKP